MQFCSKCGAELQEGVQHQCEASNSSKAPMPQIDKDRAIGLLRKPLTSLSLNGEKDLVYGILGIAASLIGFVLWAAALKSKLIDSFDFGDSGFFDVFSENIGKQLPIIRDFFFIGLISLAVFLAAVWVIGNWTGGRQLGWKDAVTKFGALQALSGIGFLASAVICMLSVKLSTLIVLILIVYTLVLSLHAAAKVFDIAIERSVRFFAFVVSIQLVVVLFVLTELTKEYPGIIVSLMFN